MSDPPAPAPQDTPPAPAPEGTPGGEVTIDWQKRYDDLRPQFDRTAQERAALAAEVERVGSDAEYQRQLMAQWGYEVEESAPDPAGELRQQLAELQEWKTNLTAEQQQAQQLQALNSSVEEQFRALGPDLDKETREWIESKALTIDPRDDGMPDIAGAHKAFTDWELARKKAWQQTKHRAPHIPAGGTAGTNAPDLDKMNPTELAEWMANEAIARMQS